MRKSLLIISLLLGHFLSFAQIDHTRGIWDVFEHEEYNYIPSSGVLDSRNGYRLSPHGEIRFLLAFVELEYSNPENDPSPTGTVEWPVGQLPVWKDDLLEIHAPSGLSNKYFTKYFQMASSNSHVVLGDYLVAPDNGGVFKISTIDGNVNNNTIINCINQKLGNAFTTAHGFSSISDFDIWTVTHNGEIKLNIGNNKWDFVVFIIRNSIKPDNLTGYSSLYDNPSLLGYPAENCSRVCTFGKNPSQIIRHTCLYYPFNIDIFAFDDQLGSFGRVKHQFNGYAELYQGSTLQGFLQSGKLANPSDLDYIFNKARTL